MRVGQINRFLKTWLLARLVLKVVSYCHMTIPQSVGAWDDNIQINVILLGSTLYEVMCLENRPELLSFLWSFANVLTYEIRDSLYWQVTNILSFDTCPGNVESPNTS